MKVFCAKYPNTFVLKVKVFSAILRSGTLVSLRAITHAKHAYKLLSFGDLYASFFNAFFDLFEKIKFC